MIALGHAGAAWAEDAQAPSPVDAFTQQQSEIRKALSGLGAKIDQSLRSIEKLTKPDAAAAELDAFMGEISEALALLSDNGTVATAAEKAIDFARAKLREAETGNRFGAEEQRKLAEGWRDQTRETETAAGELMAARRELVQLLTALQSKRDLLTEWQLLANAQSVTSILRQLSADIRGVSSPVRNYLRKFGGPES